LFYTSCLFPVKRDAPCVLRCLGTSSAALSRRQTGTASSRVSFPRLITMQIPTISRTAKAMLLTFAICSPLTIHQYAAYRIFCKDNSPRSPAWCHHTPPAIYSYVQSTYWNSGLFLYWTPSQLPNIMLASPILALLFAFGASYLTTLFPILWTRLSQREHLDGAELHAFDPFLHLDLAPHVIHGLLMSVILLCAAHTQIALRQAPSMPLTYWAAAWLLMKYPICGRIWVAWSAVWGAISVILWAAFLPPA
jgi:GPI mannosyltransferase 2